MGLEYGTVGRCVYNAHPNRGDEAPSDSLHADSNIFEINCCPRRRCSSCYCYYYAPTNPVTSQNTTHYPTPKMMILHFPMPQLIYPKPHSVLTTVAIAVSTLSRHMMNFVVVVIYVFHVVVPPILVMTLWFVWDVVDLINRFFGAMYESYHQTLFYF